MSSPIIPLPKANSNRILLVLQFWEHDKAQAMALARLLADIEPNHTELADILFLNRFDCKPDHQTVKYVSRKFNVFSYQSARRSTGWPRGCNGLFFGGAEYLYHMSAENKATPRYKAAFFLEADCCPLSRDWLRTFSKTWDSFNNKIFVSGCRVESEGVWEHINGNCFISGDLTFLHWLVKTVGEPANIGWDYVLAAQFRTWGVKPMPGMEFVWRTPTLTPPELLERIHRDVIWLHGVKDFSALQFARKHLLT
jgi:hypothetical protein